MIPPTWRQLPLLARCASLLALAAVAAAAPLSTSVISLFNKYNTHSEISHFLGGVSRKYSKWCKLESIGKSVEGRDVWVLRVSSGPGPKPELFYMANMHGDEIVGAELLLRLIALLVDGLEAKDERIKRLVDAADIYLFPSVNPDGAERAFSGGKATRGNAAGYDLNRNFPDPWHRNEGPIQPETQAVMDWFASHNFVLGANLHGGDYVVSYPFDAKIGRSPRGYSSSPHDELYRHLSKTYASALSVPVTGFAEGITNGADWYALWGGMQDWTYRHYGVIHVTVEMTKVKYPPYETVAGHWANHKEAMLQYLEKISSTGVRGFVTDACTGQPILGARVSSSELDSSQCTAMSGSVHGDYYRLLLPGKSRLTVKAEGYLPLSKEVEVRRGEVAVLNFSLPCDSTGVIVMNFKEDAPPPSKNVVISNDQYKTHADISKFLGDVSQKYPTWTKLESIGKSVEGRDLWTLRVSSGPGPKPEIFYMANMHGDEIVGAELVLRFIALLVDGLEAADERIKRLVDAADIYLLPSVNPDGAERAFSGGKAATRANAAGYDLNRNFPDLWGKNEGPIQPETQAAMDWFASHNFVLGANFHGGDYVVSYPFDANDASRPKGYASSPHDELYRHLSKTYASALSEPVTGFPEGITNGADWYSLWGGMQDWTYRNYGVTHVTVEATKVKYPPYDTVAGHWSNHKEAMLRYLEKSSSTGVRGFVTDACTNQTIPGARVSSSELDVEQCTAMSGAVHGDYYRLLLPGTARLTVTAEGYLPMSQEVEVRAGEVAELNFSFDCGAAGVQDLKDRASSNGVADAVLTAAVGLLFGIAFP